MGKWDDTEKYNLIFMIEVPEKCNQTACASFTDEEIKYRFIFNTSQHDFVRNSSTQLNFLFTCQADLEITGKGNSKNVILQRF